MPRNKEVLPTIGANTYDQNDVSYYDPGTIDNKMTKIRGFEKWLLQNGHQKPIPFEVLRDYLKTKTELASYPQIVCALQEYIYRNPEVIQLNHLRICPWVDFDTLNPNLR